MLIHFTSPIIKANCNYIKHVINDIIVIQSLWIVIGSLSAWRWACVITVVDLPIACLDCVVRFEHQSIATITNYSKFGIYYMMLIAFELICVVCFVLFNSFACVFNCKVPAFVFLWKGLIRGNHRPPHQRQASTPLARVLPESVEV